MILAGQLKNLLFIGPLRTTQLEDKVCIFVELFFKNKNKCERCEVELLNKNKRKLTVGDGGSRQPNGV